MKQLLVLLTIALSSLTFAAPAKSQHFLWKAEKDGQQVWLLGSVHMGRADFFPLPKEVEDAYKHAKTLAVEADITDSSAMLSMVDIAMLPASDTVGKHLSEAENAKLDKALQSVGLARPIADRMKPWLLALSLDALEMQRLGLASNEGIDLYFLRKAKAENKRVVELESLRSQLELFDTMPDSDTVAMLDATMDEINAGHFKAELDAMLDAWKAGDVTAMRRVIDEDSPDDPAIKRVNDKLFGERNRAMADKIAAMAGKTAPFVVIGAGHLASADNVLDLLRARGFKLTQY
ncbi:MAG: TraB/GumN family protein [Burkholderiales bacterium]|nr:TraB/GumN family protein [Burkholderiales bacterium]